MTFNSKAFRRSASSEVYQSDLLREGSEQRDGKYKGGHLKA